MLARRGAPWIVLGTSAAVGLTIGSVLGTLPPWPPVAISIDSSGEPASRPAEDAVSLPRIERLAPPPPDSSSGAGPVARPPPSPSCPQGWRLVGAAVVRGLPHRSAVALHAPSGATVIAIGESWLDHTLAAIEPDHAVLTNAQGASYQLGYETQVGQVGQVGQVSQVSQVGQAGQAPGSEPSEATGASTEALVERAPFQQAIESGSFERLLGPVRLLPDEGGVRIYGVRRGSALDRLGARNGDRIAAVDGRPPRLDVALELQARFLRGEAIAVTIERRGERLERTLRLSP